MGTFDLRQKEKDFLEREKLRHPELFHKKVSVDDDALLVNIGIEGAFGPRERGHIKLFPEDFIVEEISKENNLVSIEDGPIFSARGGSTFGGEGGSNEPPVTDEKQKTVWFEVVKMGVDTIEVQNELSRILGLERKFIGAAGIKDKFALTSQAVSVRGSSAEECGKVAAPNFFLKNIRVGKGALQIGDLSGNRFTIFVRVRDRVDQARFEESVRDLEEQGFWNFFYLQRFGTPRLISHKLGLLILQGQFEETVKASLTYASEREVPYFQNFRRSMLEYWGDWEKLLLETEVLSYSFDTERRMITHLHANPGDFVGALNCVPEQIKLWVYAYASYLFNKTLSRMIQSGEDVPFTLPLALGRDPRIGELYGRFFQMHHIAPPFAALKNFPFVQKAEKEIETLKKFIFNGFYLVDGGVVLDFSLEKASYATTFLSHLFVLSSGQPVPKRISIEEVDSKAILGTGTIKPLREGRFKNLFEMRKSNPIIISADD